MTLAYSIIVAFGGQRKLHVEAIKHKPADSDVLGVQFAGLGRHASSVPAHKITALLKVRVVCDDSDAKYPMTFTLLGILCDTVLANNGISHSQAVSSCPSSPYLHHSQVPDRTAGYRHNNTSVVGKPHSCRRFHLFSDPINLAADH